MADWTHLQRDASERGGFLLWPIEIPEGQDILLELGGVVSDDEWQPYDWTACTSPVAAIYDSVTEAVIATLTWVPRADGTFSFTATRTALAGAAGDKAVYLQGRDLSWACQVTVPGGSQVQLVAESPCTIRHKGVS